MASDRMSDGAKAFAAWHNLGMTQKPPKRPRDPSQLASIIATGERPDRDPTPEEQGKAPAAVALARRGGRARAASMRAKRRSEMARKTAKAR